MTYWKVVHSSEVHSLGASQHVISTLRVLPLSKRHGMSTVQFSSVWDRLCYDVVYEESPEI